MTITLRSVVPGALAVLLVAHPAAAQTWEGTEEPPAEPTEPAEPAEPAEPTEPAPDVAAQSGTSAPATAVDGAAPAAAASEASCVPACRSGFVCIAGACESACNPPCPTGQQCTGEGQCELVSPPPATLAPESPEVPEVPEVPEGSTPARGAHTHDGFYLRMGFGFGGVAQGLELDTAGGEGTATTGGFGVMSEVAIGGTIARGFVLGFGVYSADVPGTRDLEMEVPGPNGFEGTVEVDKVSTGVVGPFIDYYFNPERGLHLQAAVGVGVSSFRRRGDGEEINMGGLGAMLGVGYEWWIGEQWSMGGLARVLWSGVSGEDRRYGDEYTGSVLAPGLLLTATYH